MPPRGFGEWTQYRWLSTSLKPPSVLNPFEDRSRLEHEDAHPPKGAGDATITTGFTTPVGTGPETLETVVDFLEPFAQFLETLLEELDFLVDAILA